MISTLSTSENLLVYVHIDHVFDRITLCYRDFEEKKILLNFNKVLILSVSNLSSIQTFTKIGL